MATATMRIQICLNQNQGVKKPCIIPLFTNNEKFHKKLIQLVKQKLQNKVKSKKKSKPLRLFLVETGQEITIKNINKLINPDYADNFTSQTLTIAVSLGEEFQGKILSQESLIKDVCIIRNLVSHSESCSEAEMQLNQLKQLKGIKLIVGQPDLHPGKNCPIGVSVISEKYVYPHLIGTDIGCGMALIETPINKRIATLQKINCWINDINLESSWIDQQCDGEKMKFMNNILCNELIDWPKGTKQDGISLDEVKDIDIHSFDDALGSIGHGNHFAELQQIDEIVDETLFKELGLDQDKLFLMIHSGSRGFGASVLDNYLKTHSAHNGLNVDSDDFKNYMKFHDNAIKWARKNRMIIAERFINCMGNGSNYDIANCVCHIDIYHNYLCGKSKDAFKDTQQEIMEKMKQRGDNMDIKEEKLENEADDIGKAKKNKDKETLDFIDIYDHKLSLCHAPTNDLLQFWYDRYGITDIVSLIRRDEPKCRDIMKKCNALNIKWHHFPISGAKQLCSNVTQIGFETATKKRMEDMKSLLRIQDIIDILKFNDSKKSNKIVIHCAAGQHRTGIFAYLVMRQLGYNKQDTLKLIEKIRKVAFRELTWKRKPNTWFHDKQMKTMVDFAEAYLQYFNETQQKQIDMQQNTDQNNNDQNNNDQKPELKSNDNNDKTSNDEIKQNDETKCDNEDLWYIHRKGAAPADCGYVVIPGSRGSKSYIVKPIAKNYSGYSIAHGAGRKLMRSQAMKKMSKWFPNVNVLSRTDIGSYVICQDKNLMYEESPQAYKQISNVIQDLKENNLIQVVATLKPILTYKMKTKGKEYKNTGNQHKQSNKKSKHKSLVNDILDYDD